MRLRGTGPAWYGQHPGSPLWAAPAATLTAAAAVLATESEPEEAQPEATLSRKN